MDHIIKTDKLTNDNCCLFVNSFADFKDNKSININVQPCGLADLTKLQISTTARSNYNVSVNEIDDWENTIKDIPYKKGLWVIIDCYVPENGGHVLGDEVFAVWQSLCVFGLQNENFNIITSNDYKHKQLYKCITKNKLFSRNDFKQKILFEKLIVGASRNGYALGHQLQCGRNLSCRATYLPPFEEVFESFRKRSYKIFDIDEKLLQNKKRSIVILSKHLSTSEHKSALYDVDKLITLISEQHKTHEVKKVNWEGMDIGDQIKEMSMADLVISLPGSDLMNCILLNPNSAIISPIRYVYDSVGNDTYYRDNGNEIGIWFRYTHKCIKIEDVSMVKEGNVLYTKINDIHNFLNTIKNCMDSKM